MTDFNLGQIEDDLNFDFKNKYDDEGHIFADNSHSCKYYEMEEFKNDFRENNNCFSTYSHNIRSINGHWDDILDIISSAQPMKFSVLAFQEIWSVQKLYEYLVMENLNIKLGIKKVPPTPIVGVVLDYLLITSINIMKY